MSSSDGKEETWFAQHPNEAVGWVRVRLQQQGGDGGPVAVALVEDEKEVLASNAELDGEQQLSQPFSVPSHAALVPCMDEGARPVDVADLAMLQHLHMAPIVATLRERHLKDCIYTMTGSTLIALNPFKRLPLYTKDVSNRYRFEGEQQAGTSSSTRLPPHLYSIADNAYRDLMRRRRSQSVIIGGESGAGKTETAKLVLRYLAHVKDPHPEETTARSHHPRRSLMSPEELGMVELRLMESNPLLEAFGNATTTRNDNSSRFGKFVRVFFNGEGRIAYAELEHYLLEKSRVVTQAEGERNYHAFYQLLAGADTALRTTLHLDGRSPADFAVTREVDVPHVDDRQEFEDTMRAMTFLGLGDDVQRAAFCVLAAILHFGNVTFTEKSNGCELSDPALVALVADLLAIDRDRLIASLTSRFMKVGPDTIVVPLTVAQALAQRDAFSKSVYDLTFSWLIDRVNASLRGDDSDSQHAIGSIGLLDIFGFECFPHNSFEQLCINFANERVQNLYIRRLFKDELQIYEADGIQCDAIDYTDNAPTLEALLGVLDMLSEECVVPKGTDLTFCQKLHHFAPAAAGVLRFPRLEGHDSAFIIEHYAGAVTYAVEGFLDKNRDKVSDEHRELLHSSLSDDIRAIMGDNLTTAAASGGSGDALKKDETKQPSTLRVSSRGKASHSVASRFLTVKTDDHAHQRRMTDSGPRTPRGGRFIAQTFKAQLGQLMAHTQPTRTHFVRCIKPTDSKRPLSFHAGKVLQQLNCVGVLACVRIRRSGYPERFTKQDFVRLYAAVALSSSSSSDATPEAVLAELKFTSPADFQIGTTKVFLRQETATKLDDALDTVHGEAATTLQACVRAALVRRCYVETCARRRAAATSLQASVRQWLAQKAFRLRLEQKRQEEAQRKAEEEARRKAEEEAQRKAEEEARRKAEEKAEADRRKAEEEARELKEALHRETATKEKETEEEAERKRRRAEFLKKQQSFAHAHGGERQGFRSTSPPATPERAAAVIAGTATNKPRATSSSTAGVSVAERLKKFQQNQTKEDEKEEKQQAKQRTALPRLQTQESRRLDLTVHSPGSAEEVVAAPNKLSLLSSPTHINVTPPQRAASQKELLTPPAAHQAASDSDEPLSGGGGGDDDDDDDKLSDSGATDNEHTNSSSVSSRRLPPPLPSGYLKQQRRSTHSKSVKSMAAPELGALLQRRYFQDQEKAKDGLMMCLRCFMDIPAAVFPLHNKQCLGEGSTCPLCFNSFDVHMLQNHVSLCQGTGDGAAPPPAQQQQQQQQGRHHQQQEEAKIVFPPEGSPSHRLVSLVAEGGGGYRPSVSRNYSLLGTYERRYQTPNPLLNNNKNGEKLGSTGSHWVVRSIRRLRVDAAAAEDKKKRLLYTFAPESCVWLAKHINKAQVDGVWQPWETRARRCEQRSGKNVLHDLVAVDYSRGDVLEQDRLGAGGGGDDDGKNSPARRSPRNLGSSGPVGSAQLQEEPSVPFIPPTARGSVRHSLTLSQCLRARRFRAILRTYLEENYCEENLDFLEAVEDYQQHRQGLGVADHIFQRYVKQGAELQVNIDAPTRIAVRDTLAQLKADGERDTERSLFNEAARVVHHMVEKDVFQRFIDSTEYAEMLASHLEDQLVSGQQNLKGQGWKNENGAHSISITVLSAKEMSEKKMSPYCVISVGGKSARTATIKHTLAPEWNERVDFPLSSATQYVEVNVMDHGIISSDSFVGGVLIPIEYVVQAEPIEYLLLARQRGQKVQGTLRLVVSLSKDDPMPMAKHQVMSEEKGPSLSDVVRGKVSKKKVRFQEDGFDLDLTYITDRLIAMGYPSESLERIYRNRMSDVQKFFHVKHPDSFKIYNLCSERQYPPSRFNQQVAWFPFDDHHPPPFSLIPEFVANVVDWLSAHPQNVAAVHCKAGKGRTGTMISAVLLGTLAQGCSTSEEALDFFADKRTQDKNGVTIPSQRRYVNYAQTFFDVQRQVAAEHEANGLPPPSIHEVMPPKLFSLRTLVIHAMPKAVRSYGVDVWIKVTCPVLQTTFSSRGRVPVLRHTRDERLEMRCRPGVIVLFEDVKLELFYATAFGEELVFQLWFNTRFVERNRVTFVKDELDKAVKDKKHKLYDRDMCVSLDFDPISLLFDDSETDLAPSPPVAMRAIAAPFERASHLASRAAQAHAYVPPPPTARPGPSPPTKTRMQRKMRVMRRFQRRGQLHGHAHAVGEHMDQKRTDDEDPELLAEQARRKIHHFSSNEELAKILHESAEGAAVMASAAAGAGGASKKKKKQHKQQPPKKKDVRDSPHSKEARKRQHNIAAEMNARLKAVRPKVDTGVIPKSPRRGSSKGTPTKKKAPPPIPTSHRRKSVSPPPASPRRGGGTVSDRIKKLGGVPMLGGLGVHHHHAALRRRAKDGDDDDEDEKKQKKMHHPSMRRPAAPKAKDFVRVPVFQAQGQDDAEKQRKAGKGKRSSITLKKK